MTATNAQPPPFFSANPRGALAHATRSTFHASRFTALLSQPADVASLAAFRILFGLLMSAAMVRFMAKGWVRELYLAPAFHFSYPGFEWIQPWPGQWMYVHFSALAALGFCIAIGFFYRLSALLFFLGFTWIELLDQTAYLNHYYLICLLSGLLVVLPAHRAWSFDVRRNPRIRADFIPAWCLNILRFQVAVVYIFAGLAKLNYDWLFRAQPLRIWLAARGDLPVIGHLLEQSWVAYSASWLGAAFDCSIVFLLLCGRTRKWAFIALILFHVATWILFNIGMFPWIMIVAATLLFPPDWPRRVLAAFKRFKLFNEYNSCDPRSTGNRPCTASPLLVAALCLYALVQVILPLRPYFSSQPPAWTCSGFNCAWQVMIVEKTGCVDFYALDPVTREQCRISLKNYITRRQEMMMAQDPYLIRDMARRLARDLKPGVPAQIKATAYASMNGRPGQLLIDPDVNLAGALPPDWITPLRPEAGAHRTSDLANRSRKNP